METALLIGSPPLAKVEQLLCQAFSPQGCLFRVRQHLLDIFFEFAVHPGHRDVGQDGGEDVVEVVGDAAAQDAERFELLRLLQDLFHLLSVGDIPDVHDDCMQRRVIELVVGHGLDMSP